MATCGGNERKQSRIKYLAYWKKQSNQVDKNSVEYFKNSPNKITTVENSEKKPPEGVNAETFKRILNRWLETVLDEPKIDDQALCVAAEGNSVVKQAG